ncbi:MotA/TolQ/ExbB proton channel family protein [Phenylobacterium sp. LjRoot164]|uniref:MotA/TolQ/ExbB proton channel family protein n=1 Tax=unclassified Phenylobacterium TaxID=2640670 RepID=UPI003ED01A22
MQTTVIPQPDPMNPVVVPEFERLNFAQVFLDASRLNQGVMLVLMVMGVAAVALWALGFGRSLSAQPSRSVGGLRYLKGMWVGALLLGLFGASFTLVSGFMGLANVRPTPAMAVLAPGYAEAMFQVMLGLAASALAVICHQDLDARLRRLAA